MATKLMSLVSLFVFVFSVIPVHAMVTPKNDMGKAAARSLSEDEMMGIKGGKGGGSTAPTTGSLGGTCYTNDSANLFAPGVISGTGIWTGAAAAAAAPPYFAAGVPVVQAGSVPLASVMLSGPTSRAPQDADQYGAYGFSALDPGDYTVSASWTRMVNYITYGQTYNYSLNGSNSGTVVAGQNTQVGIKMDLSVTVI